MQKNAGVPAGDSNAKATGTVIGGHALIFLAMTIVLVKVLPQFVEEAKRLGDSLPRPTRFLIGVWSVVSEDPALFVIFAVLALALDGWVYYVLRRHVGQKWGRLWSVLIVILLGSFYGFAMISVCLPVVALR